MPRFTFDVTRPALETMKMSPIIRLAPDTMAFRAAKDMCRNKVNALAVTESNGKFAGIVTERHFFKKLPLEKGAAQRMPLHALMTPVDKLVRGSHTCSMDQVVKRMRKEKVRNFPLLDEEGHLHAIVNMRNVAEQIFDGLNSSPDQEGADVTIGDMLDSISVRDGLASSLPPYASVGETIEVMREKNSGSMLVLGMNGVADSFISLKTFGIFSERDYVRSIELFDERSPYDIMLHEVRSREIRKWPMLSSKPCATAPRLTAPRAASQVSRFTSGHSMQTMAEVHASPTSAETFPEKVTAVRRQTPIRDALALMLANKRLYCPVTKETGAPLNIVSLRDINLFLAPQMGEELSS